MNKLKLPAVCTHLLEADSRVWADSYVPSMYVHLLKEPSLNVVSLQPVRWCSQMIVSGAAHKSTPGYQHFNQLTDQPYKSVQLDPRKVWSGFSDFQVTKNVCRMSFCESRIAQSTTPLQRFGQAQLTEPNRKIQCRGVWKDRKKPASGPSAENIDMVNIKRHLQIIDSATRSKLKTISYCIGPGDVFPRFEFESFEFLFYKHYYQAISRIRSTQPRLEGLNSTFIPRVHR